MTAGRGAIIVGGGGEGSLFGWYAVIWF